MVDSQEKKVCTGFVCAIFVEVCQFGLGGNGWFGNVSTLQVAESESAAFRIASKSLKKCHGSTFRSFHDVASLFAVLVACLPSSDIEHVR
eukprot:335441-Amphidinium_carterae.1